MAAQQTAVANLSALLKKTSHYDKDERYMATSDLCEVLKRHQQQQQSAAAALAGGVAADHPAAGVGGAVAAAVVAAATPPFWDAATERQICTAVLRLLHDKSNDVQAIAVKTLSVLLTTVQQEQVIEIADSLADQVLDSNKSELRDVYAIGLRTLIKTIPAAHGNAVSQRLVTRLIDGCALKVEDITLVCLDALTDLLSRFGLSAAVVRQHDVVLQVCLRELSSSEFAVVRKRAGTALSCLAVVLSDTLLHRMVENILSTMESSDPTSDTVPALIRTMCGVSGAVGHRLGQDQIDRIVPIFLKHTPTAALASMEESSNTIAANELRESCFMGFESFVLRCPRQIEPHLESMVLASLAYMSYDPNYSYDDDGGGGDDSEEDEDAMSQDDGNEDHEMQDDEEEDDYHEEDDDEDDDDDDESWKVRRSAIKAIRGVVESHRHDPSDMWTRPYAVATTEQQPSASVTVATALVRRFKEREENCRVGVVECFNRLLTVTIQAQQHQPSSRAATGGEDDVVMSSGDSNDGDVGGADDVIPIVRATAPKVVRACQKILALRGNERSKSAALALLSTLCCAPGGFGGPAQISKVFGHVKSFLQQVDGGVAPPPAGAVSTHHLAGGSKALRLDALSLIHAVLVSPNHNPEHVRQNLPLLLPALCGAVQEQWYKVIAEALRAIAAVPKFYDDGSGSTHPEVASRLYGAVAPLLAANDVDQEIKECALKACASILSSLPSSLTKDESTHLLRLLLERLQNETTRVAAMKTLSQVATSRVVDVSPILADAIATLAGFLKLAGRTLQQSSLEALDTLIVHHGALAELQGGELYSSVLRDFAGLVVDSDLHLSHLSLYVMKLPWEVQIASARSIPWL
jgi:cullin-associated NEDD8-dissociated protein 1